MPHHGKDNGVNESTTTSARAITRAASTQTYYTIRFLVDRDRVEDAFRAYAYFRWVDDVLDADAGSGTESWTEQASRRAAFLRRQQSLLESCFRGEPPERTNRQERMLIELVRNDPEKNSGLQLYLRNMMKVMEFDAGRRGRLISQAELDDYTRWLATAVTECIHYFIGHDTFTPRDETRYLAVSGAHIVHMLRDTFDDARLGYYNIPRETLEAGRLNPLDVHSAAYCAWVRRRLQLARDCFQAGKAYFGQVQEPRCRLASLAYIARFEWVLKTIEEEGCRLRPEYGERKSARAGLEIAWLTLSSLVAGRPPEPLPRSMISPPQEHGSKKSVESLR